jgi:urease accessory protein
MAASAATAKMGFAPHPDRASGGWHARLELELAFREGRTLLSRRRHTGPLVVQRPFYPEGTGVCHLYVLHPPGGLVGGDELALDVNVKTGAAALVTTPAAGKVYRTLGTPARQKTTLSVASGAALEWLPQEMIVFDRAVFNGALSVDLEPDSRFIGWDAVCFGRAASGETFERGTYRQALEVRKGGELILDEPTVALPGSIARSADFGFARCALALTLVASPATQDDVEAVARVLDARRAGVTLLGDLLVVRALCESSTELRLVTLSAWELLRPRVLGRPACPPRIWRT